jgi:hypothetical protein
MRYVLGEEGTFGDFSRPGALAEILRTILFRPLDRQEMIRRRETMRNRFAWESIADGYFKMFRAAAEMPMGEPAGDRTTAQS